MRGRYLVGSLIAIALVVVVALAPRASVGASRHAVATPGGFTASESVTRYTIPTPMPTPTIQPTVAAPPAPARCDPSASQRIIVPVYGYQEWQQILDIARAPAVGVVIANIDVGPGAVFDPYYAGGIAQSQQAGVCTVGYVRTMHGARPIADVESEIKTWYDRYAVDGIFLDEGSNNLAMLSYYQTLDTFIKSLPGPDLVIMNPGSYPPRQMLAVADITVVDETTQAAYPATRFPDWATSTPAREMAHIVSGVPDTHSALASDLAFARQWHAGWVYLTDLTAGVYQSLPDFWDDEIATVAGG